MVYHHVFIAYVLNPLVFLSSFTAIVVVYPSLSPLPARERSFAAAEGRLEREAARKRSSAEAERARLEDRLNREVRHTGG